MRCATPRLRRLLAPVKSFGAWRRVAGPGLFFGATVVALLFGAPNARAETQWNTGLRLGAGGRGLAGEYWQETRFLSGLRGDVLFGQEGPLDLGLGPYLDVSSLSFDDVRPGTGLSLHLPFAEYLSSVWSLGGNLRLGRGATEPGLSTQVFLGPRSHNFHGSYAVSGGLVLGVDHSLGNSEETVVVLALHLDGQIVTLPFIAAYTWLTH